MTVLSPKTHSFAAEAAGRRSGGTRMRKPRSNHRTVVPRSPRGEPTVAPRHGVNRQHFELTLTNDDSALEVHRLGALGPTRLGGELADPDSNRSCLRPC